MYIYTSTGTYISTHARTQTHNTWTHAPRFTTHEHTPLFLCCESACVCVYSCMCQWMYTCTHMCCESACFESHDADSLRPYSCVVSLRACVCTCMHPCFVSLRHVLLVCVLFMCCKSACCESACVCVYLFMCCESACLWKNRGVCSCVVRIKACVHMLWHTTHSVIGNTPLFLHLKEKSHNTSDTKIICETYIFFFTECHKIICEIFFVIFSCEILWKTHMIFCIWRRECHMWYDICDVFLHVETISNRTRMSLVVYKFRFFFLIWMRHIPTIRQVTFEWVRLRNMCAYLRAIAKDSSRSLKKVIHI